MNSTLTWIALLIIWISCFASIQAQLLDTATFDSFDLGIDEFVNDAGELDVFQDQDIRLPNHYDSNFDAWMGWAISSMTDSTTPGFQNQYSAISGRGYFSNIYAVAGAFGGSIVRIKGEPTTILGMMITNSTYTYLSMLEGDAFAKRFGGESGDDPDYFILSARAFYADSLSVDSTIPYLADYRFADNSEDYIIRDWTYFDLSTFGEVDSILLNVWSSDVGLFGINTPAYFCMDFLPYHRNTTTAIEEDAGGRRVIQGNPVDHTISIQWDHRADWFSLFGIDGKIYQRGTIQPGFNQIDVSTLKSGTYLLRFSAGRKTYKIAVY